MNDTDHWVDREVDVDAFPDARLGKRCRAILHAAQSHMGGTIPTASQDWAATKGAYRFFDNPRIESSAILAGHFKATASRFASASGPVFVLHDTTEFTYNRSSPEKVGKTNRINLGKDSNGRSREHTVCGLLLHASLVVTSQGVPLGLSAAKFWSRKEFHSDKAAGKAQAKQRPIEEKESYRWIENIQQSTALLADSGRIVHITDREGDMRELFAAVMELGAHFLVRSYVERKTGDGGDTITELMAKTEAAGLHRIWTKGKDGKDREAELHVKYARTVLHPPGGGQKERSPIEVTVIRAHEANPPAGQEGIEWTLLTDKLVDSFRDAVEKLEWYGRRWKVETYFKNLKSGCRAEDSRLRTSDRLIGLLSVFCIVAWRMFWLSMMNRAEPEAPAESVFTDTEIKILKHCAPEAMKRKRKHTVSEGLNAVARLGGYLARKSDPPPGNLVLWRGFRRLIDIHLGYDLGINGRGPQPPPINYG